ncbi:MAG: HAD family hydrolase [Parcubacteria group bacterium Gr01-1014_72]|nr:MAG: HAD family hydrolase [Parcubacteria group bacterium Gr01-1014_72]
MKNRIHAVIFDCDGVIGDTEPLHLVARQIVYARYGFILTREFYIEAMMSRSHEEQMRAASCDPKHSEVIRSEVRNVYNLMRQELLREVPGAADCLRRFGGDFFLAVASTQPRDVVVGVIGQAVGNALLHLFGRNIVSGEDVPNNKPAPDVYLKTAELLGIAPANCVAIEDSVPGVKAAKAAGMRCIGFMGEFSTRQSLLGAGADIVAEGHHQINRETVESLSLGVVSYI